MNNKFSKGSEQNISSLQELYSKHSIDQMIEAFLTLCSNRKEHDKHSLSYFLNMIDHQGHHLQLCDIRKRSEIFDRLKDKLERDRMMIFRLVCSDYTASKLLKLLQNKQSVPEGFQDDYLALKEHLAEGAGYICSDILQQAWEYFSEIPFSAIEDHLIESLKLDRMYEQANEGGASC